MFPIMHFQEWTKYVFLLLLAISVVSGYSTGAPAATCMTMFPKHHGTQTQLETGVFTVNTDTLTYLPNQNIKIRISSPLGKPFKGVQIRAHRTEINQEEMIGSFTNLVPASKLQYVSCQGRYNNMVTHKHNDSVLLVEMTWVSPAINVGPVIFDVTVVESFYIIYYGLRSGVINPTIGSPAIPYPQIIAPIVNGTVTPIKWDTCGDTKGCLLYPRYCTGDNCKAAMSYVANRSNEMVTFELMVKDTEYVSLGFSFDQTMGDDQTISCTSVYDRVTIQYGWNHPLKHNVQEMKTNLSKLEATRSQDGNIYCRFTRPILMDMTVAYGENVTPVTLTFDLNKEHYLFVAWGKTYEKSDVLGYHYEMPVMSETMVDFFDNSIYRGSVMSKLIRAHSTMMAVAWMGFASLAIMMARHYKDGFREKKICGLKIWFHIHRISAFITFALTVAGVVVVLVKLDGKVTMKESAHTHMCLGFTVVALVCAQLLGGLFRPAPERKFRPIFNFVHRLLGTSAIVIATAALFCAYKIRDFSYDMQRFGERTMAVWAGVLVFLEILHTGYSYFTSAMCIHTSRSDEYNLDKDTDQEPRKPESSSNILLAIFLIFVACSITAAFIMTLFF